MVSAQKVLRGPAAIFDRPSTLARESARSCSATGSALEGRLTRFALDPKTTPNGCESELDIFTTRPDTLFGAKFMAISPRSSARRPRRQPRTPRSRTHRELQAFRARPAGDFGPPPRRRASTTGNERRSIPSITVEAPVLRGQLHLRTWHRARSSACPAHDQARPRLRQQIRDRQYAGRVPSGPGPKTFVITDTA